MRITRSTSVRLRPNYLESHDHNSSTKTESAKEEYETHVSVNVVWLTWNFRALNDNVIHLKLTSDLLEYAFTQIKRNTKKAQIIALCSIALFHLIETFRPAPLRQEPKHCRNFAIRIEIDITMKTLKKLTHILNSAEYFPGLHIFVRLLITSTESGISNEALP